MTPHRLASTVSALSIPESAVALKEAIEKVWSFLESAESSDLPVFRKNRHVQPHTERFTDAEVNAEIERRHTDRMPPPPPLRELEARALLSAPDSYRIAE